MSAHITSRGVKLATLEARLPGAAEEDDYEVDYHQHGLVPTTITTHNSSATEHAAAAPSLLTCATVRTARRTGNVSVIVLFGCAVFAVLTLIDLSDAITKQRIEFQQHMRVLDIDDIESIEKLQLQRAEAEYFTRRSQIAMIVLRVWHSSAPYRLYYEVSSYAQANADALSAGFTKVVSNQYTMLGLMLVALLLFARFCIAVYTLHFTTSNIADASDKIVNGLAKQLAHQQQQQQYALQ